VIDRSFVEVLVSNIDDVSRPQEDEEDPVLLAYLDFLDQEMAAQPELVQPLDLDLLVRMDALVEGVDVELDECLCDEAEPP
jgi:hypothetical protein